VPHINTASTKMIEVSPEQVLTNVISIRAAGSAGSNILVHRDTVIGRGHELHTVTRAIVRDGYMQDYAHRAVERRVSWGGDWDDVNLRHRPGSVCHYVIASDVAEMVAELRREHGDLPVQVNVKLHMTEADYSDIRMLEREDEYLSGRDIEDEFADSQMQLQQSA
jgi:hypothetical protein